MTVIDLTLYGAVIAAVLGLGIQAVRFIKQNKSLNPSRGKAASFNITEFISNTLFQIRLFKAGKVRWFIHFLLLIGFLYLLIVHGLHAVTATLFFNDYQPTLDPFQFLRNLAGLFVMIGCLTFLARRGMDLRINKDRPVKVKGLVSVILILLLIGSGFLLEATKIVSEPIFMEMVEEFSDIDDEDDLADLKLYWKENYTVHFQAALESSAERMENGRFLNEDYCLYCHSYIKSAVVSNPMAKTIYSAGGWLNENRVDRVFYWIHYGLCLVLLIGLPFSRMFHILMIPFASARKKLDARDLQPGKAVIGRATLQACTNCGFCSEVCSVYPNYQILENPDILPHSKIESVKAFLNNPDTVDIQRLNAGNEACTLCRKCTDICPSGIDLQGLWAALDNTLIQRGQFGKAARIGQIPLNEWDQKPVSPDLGGTGDRRSFQGITTNLADHTEAFEGCIQCTICTNVCPVVDYDADSNDLTPHQIMNLLRLDKKHLATGTRMVWTCLTCYACQENCPQQILVTDILLELRNAGGRTADTIQNKKIHEAVE